MKKKDIIAKLLQFSDYRFRTKSMRIRYYMQYKIDKLQNMLNAKIIKVTS